MEQESEEDAGRRVFMEKTLAECMRLRRETNKM